MKIYTDEGISAVSTKNRDGFKEMIDNAISGKIDLIITKSVSRFARNTVDTLTTVRKLKKKGVEVYFEKENIYSLDSKGELLLIIMSSLAQEESRSISENVTWGHRKRFEEGKISLAYSNFLGYEKGKDGLPQIVEKEAQTIKFIYKWFLEGKTPYGICKNLSEMGILSPKGKSVWSKSTVMSILTNEKYKGEAILQNSFTVDYLTKKTKKNEGEVPMYHVKNSHEAIISPEIFDMVQVEIEKRKKLNRSHSGNSVFSSKIICGCCGEFYGPRTFHSNSKYKRVVWQCSGKNKNRAKCETAHLYKENIEKIFINNINKLIENKDEIIQNCKDFIKNMHNTEFLEIEKARLCDESRLLYNKIQNYIDLNATETLNQENYKEHYTTMSSEYEELKKQIENTDLKIKDKRAEIIKLERFIENISKNEFITEFSEKLFTDTIEKIVVSSYTKATIYFKNGQKMSLNLEN